MYNIRSASADDASYIAPLLLAAMEEIVYEFIGQKDYEEAVSFLENFVRQSQNQYSYQNCFVAEEQSKVIGAVCVYEGWLLESLRQPIADFINIEYKKTLIVENETQAGEIYIDSLGVLSAYRGKGVGKRLLNFLISKYAIQANKKLGLLVDVDNPKAKRLYEKLGFKKVGNKTLAGKTLEHLQV